MDRSKTRMKVSTNESAFSSTQLATKSSFFLDCIRNISLFLGSNSHIVELSDIQEDLDGLSQLSNELQKVRDQNKE